MDITSQKGFVQIPILVAILVGFVVVGTVGYIGGVKQLEKKQESVASTTIEEPPSVEEGTLSENDAHEEELSPPVSTAPQPVESGNNGAAAAEAAAKAEAEAKAEAGAAAEAEAAAKAKAKAEAGAAAEAEAAAKAKAKAEAEAAAKAAEVERKERAVAALSQLSDFVDELDIQIAAVVNSIEAKGAEIDGVNNNPWLTESVRVARVNPLILEYNALIDERDYLLGVRSRASEISFALSDYFDYGTIVPAADRAQLSSWGISF